MMDTTAAIDWKSWLAGYRPMRKPDVREYTSQGETVVFHPETGNAYHLNETALAVWSLCNGRTPAGGLGRELARQFDISEETAQDHAEQLLVFFAEAGLLECQAPEIAP